MEIVEEEAGRVEDEAFPPIAADDEKGSVVADEKGEVAPSSSRHSQLPTGFASGERTVYLFQMWE